MNSTDKPSHILPDVSIAPRLVAISSTFFTLALLLFTCRIYIRYHNRGLGKDDLALSAGMAAGTGLYALQIISVINGTGRHVFYVSSRSLELHSLLNLIIGQFYVWSVTMVKISLSFMLLRIKDGRAWRIGLYSLIIFQSGVAVSSVLLDGLRCRPMRAAWDFSIPRNRCMPLLNYRTSIYISSSIFMLTDIIYSCIPIIIISRIHRPLRERIVICFLMALGVLATAATIPKIISIRHYGLRGDVTFLSSDVILWSLLEVYIGIIAACVPTLRAVFEKCLKKLGFVATVQSGTTATELGYMTHQPGDGRGMESSKTQGLNNKQYHVSQDQDHHYTPKHHDHRFTPRNEKQRLEKFSWVEIRTDDLNGNLRR